MGLKQTVRAALVAGSLLISGAITANAAPIFGDGDLGDFTGELTYSAGSNTSAALTVTLTNTSAPANGGYITGFVLNNPGNLITSVSLTNVGGGATFQVIPLDNNDVSGSPYGQFDFGAALGGDFLGGGSPNGGIAVGVTDSFIINLTGTNLTSLTDTSFLMTLSTGTGAGGGYEEIVVRFRGFNNGDSDKVPGTPTSVPEPASLALLGAGLIGLGVIRRRRPAKPTATG